MALLASMLLLGAVAGAAPRDAVNAVLALPVEIRTTLPVHESPRDVAYVIRSAGGAEFRCRFEAAPPSLSATPTPSAIQAAADVSQSVESTAEPLVTPIPSPKPVVASPIERLLKLSRECHVISMCVLLVRLMYGPARN